MKSLHSILFLAIAALAILWGPTLIYGQALKQPPAKPAAPSKPAVPAATAPATKVTPLGNAAAPLEVDVAEVYRRGEYVERIGQGPRSEAESEYLEAMAPPQDDNHKWFITIVTMPNCAACDKLKQDLRNAPELQAFVNLAEPKQGWAHCNIYSIDDETQAWRFKAVQIKSYPTVIIQPPLNKRYGDPAIVVNQRSGYAGGSKELAAWLTKSIKAYVVKRSQQPQPYHNQNVPHVDAPLRQLSGYRAERPESAPQRQYPRYSEQTDGGYKQLSPWNRDIGLDPPFRPKPKTPTPSVTPMPSPVGPLGPDDIPDPLAPLTPAPNTPAPNTPSNPTPSNDPSNASRPHALVVVDGNTVSQDLINGPLGGVLKRLRERYQNLTVEIADIASIRNRFPDLAKTDLPALMVTDNGVLKEALTNLLLPMLTDTDVSLPWLLKNVLGGGTGMWIAVIGAGLYFGVRYVRKRREEQGLKPLLNSELRTALVALLASDKVQSWLDNLLKPKATPPTPPSPAPTVEIDVKK
jgi:hypothetical protein